MIHELSFLVYGGQPRKILHCSGDVVEEERQSMMKWCGNLKTFGKYDEFVSSGGLSWIDVPTSTGRRLFLRVFATTGEARDSWYFLGLVLSRTDYQSIQNYGDLVSFVESFSLDDLFRTRPDGSKLKAKFEVVDDSQQTMPPLFTEDKKSEWTNSDWIKERAKKSQHVDGNPIHIAFNPPKVRSEYTSLLLSADFPMPGLRLKPKLAEDVDDAQSQKKKNLMRASTVALLILLIPALAVGYLIGSSNSPAKLSIETSLHINGENLGNPTIRLPRKPSISMDILVNRSSVSPNDILVRASVDWITVGAAKRKSDGDIIFPCNVLVPEGAAVNDASIAALEITQGAEVLAAYSLELESAGIGVLLQPNAPNSEMTLSERKTLSGIATARYGLKSVEVEGLPVDLNLNAEGTMGAWTAVLDPGLERVRMVVVDNNGNEFESTEELRSVPH